MSLKIESNKKRVKKEKIPRTSMPEQDPKVRAKNFKEVTTGYSEEDALKYIKDYYEFYNAGMVYRNLKIRKMSYNKFAISLEESDKHTQEYSFSWNSVVKTLTINDNGKYIVE